MTTYLAVLAEGTHDVTLVSPGPYDVKLVQTGVSAGPLPGYVQSSTLLRIEALTQTAYDAIPVPSPTTLYVIIP